MKRLLYTTLLVIAPLFLAACDFTGVEKIGDDFDIIIELPPINTLVTGQIVDASTGEPVEGSVRLTFAGPAAAQLIDVYSDPISELTVKHGLVSFGLDNALHPSEGNPVEFKVVASSAGYVSNDRTVILTEDGSGDFIVRLSPEGAHVTEAGTSSAENRTATSTAASGLAQAVVVETPDVQGTSASATATIAGGTVPRTADGTALEGALTTSLRVYDSKNGLRALPSAARYAADGRMLSIAGAVRFKVSDAAGRVAATFDGGGSSAGKSSATCTGGVSIDVTLTDAGIVEAYNLLKAADPNAEVEADIYAFSLADGQNVQGGKILLEDGDSAGEVNATLCLGGTSSSVDPALLGDVADGIVYALAIAGGQTTSCVIGSNLAVSNPNASDVHLTNLSLVGPGLNIGGGGAVLPSGSSTLSLRAALSQSDPVTTVNGVPYSVTGYVAGEPVSLEIDNICSGTYDFTVPAVTAPVTFEVSATMACPAGEEFDVHLTEQSLGALSISYRLKDQPSEPYSFIRRDQFTRTITQSSISATGEISLLPSETYRFRAVYGTDAASHEVDTPSSGESVELEFEPADAGITCSPS